MKKTIFILLVAISFSINAHQKTLGKAQHCLRPNPFPNANNEEEALLQLQEIFEEYKSDFECLTESDPKECLKAKIEKTYNERKSDFSFNNPLSVYLTKLAIKKRLLIHNHSLISDQAKQEEVKKLFRELQNLKKQFKRLFSEEIAKEL
jgi:hypothetical protein